MPVVYLLGGENVYRQSARQINQKAFQDAHCQHPSVLVFPWARASFDRKYRTRKRFFDYLRSLGASRVTFVEYAEPNQDIGKKLDSAQIVYLTGGQPSILIERLQKSGVDKLLKGFNGVIIGRSAGALALCQKFVATNRSTSRPKIAEGICLVDIALKVHYMFEEESLLKQFSEEQTIYALPECSALIQNGNELTTIDRVYLFRNGKKQIFG